MSHWPRALAALGGALALASSARATWSIVVVDRSTGEVCVASATCLGGFPLRPALALVAVGKGAAAAQSAIDVGAVNRRRMWEAMHAGADAERILADVIVNGTSPHMRQYGIVTLHGRPATWTGNLAGRGKAELRNEVGDLAYAIQGNLITGPAVCYEAERALLETEGDLAQRVMAGMEAARAMGGDGRCSCDMFEADRCGAPPDDFEKSAHTAFIVLARLGDTDGICSGGQGCANGDYYLALDQVGNVTSPDPVLVLQEKFERWRSHMRGVPDHLLSRVEPESERLVADRASETLVLVHLVDLEAEPVPHGGQELELTYTGERPAPAVAGPVTDRGQGVHHFTVRATSHPGRASWRIVVTQAKRRVQLHPELAIDVDP